MYEILKLAGWLLFSSVKFLIAPGSIYILGGYSFWETIAISIVGGWMGIIGFFYFGKAIFIFFEWIRYRLSSGIRKPKKRMNRMNRLIVSVKNHRLGLIGLALITPSLISIPVGCMLAAKYFSHDKRTIPVFLTSVVFWAFVLTTLATFLNIKL